MEKSNVIQSKAFVLIYIFKKEIDFSLFKEKLDINCKYHYLEVYFKLEGKERSGLETDLYHYYLFFTFLSRQKITTNSENNYLIYPKYYWYYYSNDNIISPKVENVSSISELNEYTQNTLSLLNQYNPERYTNLPSRIDVTSKNSRRSYRIDVNTSKNSIRLEMHFKNVSNLKTYEELYNYLDSNELLLQTETFLNNLKALNYLKSLAKIPFSSISFSRNVFKQEFEKDSSSEKEIEKNEVKSEEKKEDDCSSFISLLRENDNILTYPEKTIKEALIYDKFDEKDEDSLKLGKMIFRKEILENHAFWKMLLDTKEKTSFSLKFLSWYFKIDSKVPYRTKRVNKGVDFLWPFLSSDLKLILEKYKN